MSVRRTAPARTSRPFGTRPRVLLGTAGVLLASLALTACQDGTGTKDEGAARTTAPAGAAAAGTTGARGGASAAGGRAAPTGTGAPAGSGSSPTSAGSGSGAAGTGHAGGRTAAGASGSGKGGSGRVLCTGANTKVTARPVPRPLNHMLLTVTNTGSKWCDLTYFPVIRFDEMQWVPQGAQETQPQAVVSLAPGESGYAGVLLSAADGSGDGGMTAHRLTVGFQGMTPNSSGGPSATPALPAKGVYYDSTLAVTYWQQDRGDALNW
ncbi:DUF4232 domain-containing protein [Streptomyces tropicalis]|uniref:DUF4232 domain-containing protein n=1 Tax=Streptomyces tropicalis TaxID=3034234 RepID=A0ABT6AB06_9ACTN|nr:DUF4232 domain-containing protein [Streptomyces tropicalis]MDF3301842.1 DUF4232 domain-containing protein [Streptomyces tropicalis]